MEELTGAQMVMESLVREGTEHIFGLPGGANLPLYDQLPHYHPRVRHYLVKHEQAAAHAADAYVCVTGQVITALLGRDGFQEADITGISIPITKHSYLVLDAAEIPKVMREAFYIASTGRPGPVLVDIPRDILQQKAPFVWPEKVELKWYRP